MNEIIFLVEDDPEGGFTARAMGESIFTEADDLESLNDMVPDAVRCQFRMIQCQILIGFNLFIMAQ